MMSGVFGFSYALGAFLAGLVISESVYSQAVLSEILPLRDLFGLLFFVSLGMLVSPTELILQAPLVGFLLFVSILGKALIIFLLVLAFRYHPYTALLVGVSLAQVGEFSFIISREALRLGVISAELNGIILSVALISIGLTPLLLPLARWGYRRLRRSDHGIAIHHDEIEGVAQAGIASVLLCGYGRVGRTIAQALDTFRIPFLVIDIDRRAVEALHRRGIQAIYGDAANTRLLESLGAEKFQLAVIAVSEPSAVRMITRHLQQLNPAMRLLLRSHTDWETAQYLSLGVEGVVHVELEASLAFIEAVLTSADVDEEIVSAYLQDIRLGYYEGLHPRYREE